MPEALLVLSRFRGRNGSASPLELPPDMAVDALDVELYRAAVGRKRSGCSQETIGSVFAAPIGALYRHVPGTDPTAAELWGVGAAVVGRMAGASTFAAVTLKDTATGNAWDHRFASLNGKLFHAYLTGQARLHLWDGTEHRRVGLATPAAPTVANTGAGTYAATLRYYRMRYVIMSGTKVVCRSEPSPSVSFTPSGTGTAARVTKAAAISESETHWELEASTDNAIFYRLARTAVGTTTYDDSAAVATYPDNTASATLGAYEFPKSLKYLMALQNYLVGAGDWTSTNPQNRVSWTAALGETDEGDDERIVNTTSRRNRLDLGEADGGAVVGLGGPLYGNGLVFKQQQIWKLVPTSDPTAAFRKFIVTDKVGAIRQEAICAAVDEDGDACIYFLDERRGPYRLGKRGLQWIGEDVADIWATFSPGATNVPAWTLYYAEKHQVLFGAATGTNDPDQILAFDTQLGTSGPDGRFTGGWVRWTGGLIPKARSAVLFSTTRAASMSRDLKPYYGDSANNNRLYKGDTGTQDEATTFQSYIESGALAVAEGAKGAIGEPLVIAEVATGVTVQVTCSGDFGEVSQTGTALLTATGSETRVARFAEGIKMDGIRFLSVRIGDAAAQAAAWVIDRVLVPLGKKQQFQ